MALEAINAEDDATLSQLLALGTIQDDVEAITRGKANFEKLKTNAPRLALAAIKSEIGALEAQSRKLGEVTESDSIAIAFVIGKMAGSETKRRLFLVKEAAGWRLVPSHRN